MTRDLVLGWIAILIADGALGLVVYSAWKLICAFFQLRDDSVGVADCRAITEAIEVVARCWPDDSSAMVREATE